MPPQPQQTVRQRAFELLERGRRHGAASRAVDAFLIAVILANVLATILATAPAAQAYAEQLLWFDRACVAIFAAEYIGRLWTAPEHPMFRGARFASPRMRFAATPMMIVDLAGLGAFVAEVLFPGTPQIQLLRLVRFLKLARYTPAMSSIGHVLYDVRRALLACIVLFCGLILTAAAVMHVIEGPLQPAHLGDMPAALWWAVVFLTKLGQVEALPITTAGKLSSVVFMLVGIGFIALPVGIIGRGFYDEIRRRDFVVTFGLVSRVPLFSTLDAGTITQLVSLLKARKVRDGTVIMHKGDPADAMYFIAEGGVTVGIEGDERRLGEGDFFGEMALLTRGRRTACVTARGSCELLVLDADDFDRLLRQNPALAQAVRDTAEARQRESTTLAAGAAVKA